MWTMMRIYACEAELGDILNQIGDSEDLKSLCAHFHTDPIQFTKRMLTLSTTRG
jgi:hypothetical protein